MRSILIVVATLALLAVFLAPLLDRMQVPHNFGWNVGARIRVMFAIPDVGAVGTKPPPTKDAKVKPRSFLVGTQAVLEGNDYDVTYTATNAQNGTAWVLQATGWLRGLYLVVTGTGLTAGTAAADAPFNIFSNIELDDVNNEAIFGPFDGYSAFLTNKYGGYFFADDPATQATFALSGTTTTNNFTFVLYIPLEIVARDPIGPVASVNNTASLTLKFALNATATVFSTPTGTLLVRVRGTQDFYWEPRRSDKQGNPISPEPPAAGTTQYWTQGSYPVAGSGVINAPLNTGLGYPFREYLFVNRDGSGSRSVGETNWPDPLIGLKFEANFLISQLPKVLWQNIMSRAYGHTGAAADTRAAGSNPGKENGVYTVNWNDDFFLQRPGAETRRGYLVTSPGSNFIFNGSMGGAGTLYELVNYVAPGGGANSRDNTAVLTGGQ